MRNCQETEQNYPEKPLPRIFLRADRIQNRNFALLNTIHFCMQNFQRYKITEIPEIRFRQRRYVDAAGQVQYVPEQYTVYREVRVINGWARFGHYIIDAIIIWLLQSLVGFVIGFGMGIQGMGPGDIDLGLRLALALVNMAVLFIYYAVFEIMYSSTPAKMMLGRLVIDEYALKPEAKTIFLRTVSRLVPFEALSCLGTRGWHDMWSKTYVVDKQEAETLWNLLSEVERNQAQQQADAFRNAQQGPHL